MSLKIGFSVAIATLWAVLPAVNSHASEAAGSVVDIEQRALQAVFLEQSQDCSGYCSEAQLRRFFKVAIEQHPAQLESAVRLVLQNGEDASDVFRALGGLTLQVNDGVLISYMAPYLASLDDVFSTAVAVSDSSAEEILFDSIAAGVNAGSLYSSAINSGGEVASMLTASIAAGGDAGELYELGILNGGGQADLLSVAIAAGGDPNLLFTVGAVLGGDLDAMLVAAIEAGGDPSSLMATAAGIRKDE